MYPTVSTVRPSRIYKVDKADKRLTEIFRWIPKAPFALPKRVSALFVLQKLLHLECQIAGGLIAVYNIQCLLSNTIQNRIKIKCPPDHPPQPSVKHQGRLTQNADPFSRTALKAQQSPRVCEKPVQPL